MKNTLAVLLGTAILLIAWHSIRSGAADAPVTGLPGARPEIDAFQYPSLQAAFDAIPESGGVVRLPAGRFDISTPLELRRQDVLVVGAGTATHIHNTNQNGLPALLIQHPDGDKTKKEDRLWRVQLSNLRITGNPQSGHGIVADRVNEIFLDGVTVSEHGGDGIRLDFCYEDPRVCNSLITYNKAIGLNLIGCHDIVVSACQFEENQDALHCTDGFNLCMTGNCLDDHLGQGVVIENTYGSVLSGNMIEECKGTAVVLDRDCYGITLSANVIAHNGGGIDLRDAHGCTVSANTLTINAANAVRIGPASGRISVTGNTFGNSYLGEGKVRRNADDLGAAGLVLAGTNNISVTGNVFAGVKPKAVSADDATSRVTFVGNTLTDVASDHAELKQSVVDSNVEK